MPKCIAIVVSTGKRCGKNCTGDRCLTHEKYLQSNGAFRTEWNELAAVYKAEPALPLTQASIARHERLNAELREIEVRHNGPTATERIRPQRTKSIQENEYEKALIADRIAAIRARVRGEALIAGHIAAIRARVRGEAPPPPVAGNLAAFAQDYQNVHREGTVNQTKDVLGKLKDIKVPAEFQWNGKKCSKTPGEIIMECELPNQVAVQMLQNYIAGSTIYYEGPATYGRTLDAVWQYIKNSDDKDNLKKSLKQELTDSVDMCEQGCLSRITNVLAGYIDGLEIQTESAAEIVGRELSLLKTNEPNVEIQLLKAKQILKENKIPEEQWEDWLTPLMD